MSEMIEDWGAALDQMVKGMRDVATGTRALYLGLIEEGFSESQAVQLSSAWITALTTPRIEP